MAVKVKMAWEVVVSATEKIEDLHEWSGDVMRGLITSEMVPDFAKLTKVEDSGYWPASATVAWRTENEMELGDNYKVS